MTIYDVECRACGAVVGESCLDDRNIACTAHDARIRALGVLDELPERESEKPLRVTKTKKPKTIATIRAERRALGLCVYVAAHGAAVRAGKCQRCIDTHNGYYQARRSA